jgi:DNA topoisomerase-3
MITFGPCQTPTLGFCVQRHEEIKNHVPKTFFMLKLIVSGQSGDREAEWEGERIWNEAEAKKLVASLAGVKQFDVIEATSLEKSKARPEGVNTVQLLKFASSFLGIGP